MYKNINKILIKILIIILFISSFVLYTEIKLRQIQNSYSLRREYFENNLNNTELLILGSSESLNSINPQFIKIKSFNLSERAQSLYYDKELLLKHIDKMPNLKYVIISITYLSLWFQVHNFVDENRDYFYYHFWNIIPPNTKNIFDIRKISYIALYGITFSQNAFKKNFNINAFTDSLYYNGYVEHNEQINEKIADSLGQQVMNNHILQMQEKEYGTNIKILNEIIQLINQSRIKPILLTVPVHYTYANKMSENKYKTIKEVLENISNDYNCKYYDYTNDIRFNVNDFYDPAHLNKTGAEKFTKILNDEVINNLLREKDTLKFLN